MRRGVLLPILLLALAVSSHAAQRTLTAREVDEALLIGGSRIASDRARFHAPYRIAVAQPPIDYIDVVTPFRRIVLAAEERLRSGDRPFGQRQALELLAAADGRFDFVIELTFHPLNTFVSVPEYDVAVGTGTMRLLPETVGRVPRFGLRVSDLPPATPTPSRGVLPGGSQPMLGATITAQFAGADIDAAGVADLVLSDHGRQLAHARVDLGHLR